MRKKDLFVKFFLLLFFLFLSPKSLEAAYLKLEPATVSTGVNETFTLSVNIDTENEEVTSTDVYINYDTNLLEVQQVSEGFFFPTVTYDITSGRVAIAAFVDDSASPKKGTGTVVTITFKALSDGSVTLTVDCSSSKIVKAEIDTPNILDCSKNSSSQITIGTGDQSQLTSSPPSSLPKTGVFENFINIGLPGIVLFSLGIIGKFLLKY